MVSVIKKKPAVMKFLQESQIALMSRLGDYGMATQMRVAPVSYPPTESGCLTRNSPWSTWREMACPTEGREYH